MNTLSRTITGVILIVFGFVLIGVVVFGGWPALFWGIPLIILGFFILFNNREDNIERRKDQK